MSEILDVETIAELAENPPTPPQRFRFIRPISSVATDLVEQIRNEEGRFQFGILEVDTMIRGLGPGELCMFTGKSHSAKTQVLLNAVANNPQARILWITPDEVGELVAMKLVAITEQVKPAKLEDDLQNGDEAAAELIDRVVATKFPNLIVVDDTVDADQMNVAITEARAHWGADPDLVVFDYLELMPSDGDSTGVPSNAKALKALAKDQKVPLVVVHQASRSGGKRGQAAGIDGMRYGGEAESTVVVECFRRMDDESLSEYDRAQQAHVVTVNVAKNKRPPCNKGMIDLYIHPDYGFVRSMKAGDKGTPREFETPSFERTGRSQSELIDQIRAAREQGPQHDAF